MKKLVKVVKLNNLQYNANRDPEVYRRCIKEPFRLQALLDVLAVDQVPAPVTFDEQAVGYLFLLAESQHGKCPAG